jgi:hypothetical protein
VIQALENEEYIMSSGGGGQPIMTESSEESFTGPWEPQVPYILGGFGAAKELYNRGAPAYYGKETLAGFDPSQDVAQKATLGYAMGPRTTAQQSAAENRLIQGLGGDVDTARFDPVMDYLGREMKSNLESDVLPGIRESLVQYQPGGSSRGDIVQSQAIAKANQQMLDKASQLTYGAYSDAQDRAQNYAQLYPSIMSAPIGAYQAIDDVGAARRAMTQETINRDMARYQYESQAPQRALQDYMAMITGQYGSTSVGSGSSSQTGQKQPSQMLPVLGNIASAAIMAGSDMRIKENIVPEGTKWKGLNVYAYNYIGDTRPRRGVMAQEVEGIYPDAVVTINGIKHVKYGEI